MIPILLLVSNPMTCSRVYRLFTMYFVRHYSSFLWVTLMSLGIWIGLCWTCLFNCVWSCAFDMAPNWPSSEICQYHDFSMAWMVPFRIFAHPVVRYILIAMSLSGICYSLELSTIRIAMSLSGIFYSTELTLVER